MGQATAVSRPPSQGIAIEAYVDSAEARQAVQQLAGPLDAAISFHPGTLGTAARLIDLASFGDVLVAELGTSFETDLERVRDLARSGVRLVVLGARSDLASFRAVTAAGARDYFALPLQPADMLTLGAEEAPAAARPAGRACRRIAVCGVSGGAGASALAENLAVAYVDAARDGKPPRDGEGQVALLDADLEFGSVAVDLDTEPTAGLLDALQVPDRVDRTFLTSTMEEPLQGLSVYSANVSDGAQVSQLHAGFAPLMRKMSAEFPTLIVDLPRALLAERPELAGEFDEIVLVLGPGFSAVRNCSRLLQRIGTTADGFRATLVLSHARRGAGLKVAEITGALGLTRLHELPEAGAELARASVKGQPLLRIARKGPYGRAVAALRAQVETPAKADDARSARRTFFGTRRQGA